MNIRELDIGKLESKIWFWRFLDKLFPLYKHHVAMMLFGEWLNSDEDVKAVVSDYVDGTMYKIMLKKATKREAQVYSAASQEVDLRQV